MGLLDIIFPKYCVSCKKIGFYICADCFSKLSFCDYYVCLVCSKASIDGCTHPGCRGKYTIDGAFSSIFYKGVAKKLLYVFKYKPYVSQLREILGELFYEGIIQHQSFMEELSYNPVFVPIPLHQSKFNHRGYNQSEILAGELAKRFNLPMQHLLQRVKKTDSQVGLDREKRMDNIHHAFVLASNNKISQYPTIILVDDVLTTGSTLWEAAQVLKREGVRKVFGITLARD